MKDSELFLGFCIIAAILHQRDDTYAEDYERASDFMTGLSVYWKREKEDEAEDVARESLESR